jgi:hypothetical protein
VRTVKRIVPVTVKSYSQSSVRSYFPDKEYIEELLEVYGFALCVQDGIIFQEHNPDSLSGIVTFDDALSRPVTVRKIGWYGTHIIQCIGRSYARKKFVTGCFVSNFQINLEFRGIDTASIDKLVARIIGVVFKAKVKIIAE